MTKVKFLGSMRQDTCRGCIAGRDKSGPGDGKPYARQQRVIRVNRSTFRMQCGVCKIVNVRKLKRAR